MSSGKSDPKRIVVEAIENVGWLREESGKTFYAVGGAWRSFARLHMEQAGYPLHIIHQYDIPAEEARAVARRSRCRVPSRWRRCRASRAVASIPCRSPAWRSTGCWRR